MPPPRLTAQPIAEGRIQTSTDTRLIWRDFRWNTGKVSRMWFIDPDGANETEVEVLALDGSKNPTGRG